MGNSVRKKADSGWRAGRQQTVAVGIGHGNVVQAACPQAAGTRAGNQVAETCKGQSGRHLNQAGAKSQAAYKAGAFHEMEGAVFRMALLGMVHSGSGRDQKWAVYGQVQWQCGVQT